MDTENDDGTLVKAIWVYYVGGRNTLLYSGDPKICQGLYECINACMGQFLDLTYLTKKKAVGGTAKDGEK